jgi:RNA 3'-terminal phosphate cyclase
LAAFSAIGELRKPMEKVAEAPCKEFMRWWKSDAACDEHLADQLVLPLCFAAAKAAGRRRLSPSICAQFLWVPRSNFSH